MLKKLSISEDAAQKVKELAANNVSGLEIARIMGMSAATMWRNMVLLGVNKRKCRCRPPDEKYFDWDEYKRDTDYIIV